ncbi:ribonuclease G [Thermoactinomyces sp. CICC 10521]|jgi:hypothetical protein|uniref:ribonuclease G n=1 Tax=Thermoactinomyces sp. CICC 10521 TaxID=2767426 RepID=UPI0018DC4B4F|nr:ribonuclease G [Thermoactinomyces sp. CICC 10521]MBH8608676.1 ribonuclease G [Thermoactinomyces sp. CICC 10521]
MHIESSQKTDNELKIALKKWNWGAFFLTFICGIFHRVYFSLWVFFPVIGWIMVPFILGAKGSKWAWEKGNWRDLEEFQEKQELWQKTGFVIFIILFILFLLPMLWIIIDVLFAQVKYAHN